MSPRKLVAGLVACMCITGSTVVRAQEIGASVTVVAPAPSGSAHCTTYFAGFISVGVALIPVFGTSCAYN